MSYIHKFRFTILSVGWEFWRFGLCPNFLQKRFIEFIQNLWFTKTCVGIFCIKFDLMKKIYWYKFDMLNTYFGIKLNLKITQEQLKAAKRWQTKLDTEIEKDKLKMEVSTTRLSWEKLEKELVEKKLAVEEKKLKLIELEIKAKKFAMQKDGNISWWTTFYKSFLYSLTGAWYHCIINRLDKLIVFRLYTLMIKAWGFCIK